MPQSNGITIALNAAEARLQIAAADDAGNFLFTQEWQAVSQGVELLAPALHSALNQVKISPQNIKRIACVTGPGSFTGLRLVLTTASGLARATDALLGGIAYLPLLAANAAIGLAPWLCALPEGQPPVLWALTHARRGIVHAQGFRLQHAHDALTPCITPISDIAVLTMTENESCPDYMRQHSGDAPMLLLGSGRTRNEAYFQTEFPKAIHLPASFDHPAPTTLLQQALVAHYDTGDIAPLYVRGCDAEENLLAIAHSLGLNPDDAQQTLQRLTSLLPSNDTL